MSMNRVQFQRGLSLPAFLSRFGEESQCVTALFNARWPEGFVCPRCQQREAVQFERSGQRLWQCKHCRAQTSVTAGTPMANSKLPLRLWWLAIYLVSQSKNGIAALELGRQLGVCYRTAWRLKHKLMAAMEQRESGRLLSGLVQVDDAYLGGELSGVANGQQWKNKVPFIAAIATEQGRPREARFDCVPSFNRQNIAQWARDALGEQARVMSDGLTAFTGVAWANIAHHSLIAGRGRAAAQVPQLHWVNTILSNLKTAFSGTHHAFDFRKYGSRYLKAHQYRFNRRTDLASMVPRLASALVSTGVLTERTLRHPAETRR